MSDDTLQALPVLAGIAVFFMYMAFISWTEERTKTAQAKAEADAKIEKAKAEAARAKADEARENRLAAEARISTDPEHPDAP